MSADGKGLASQAGALLLAEAARVTGLSDALTAGLAPVARPVGGARPGEILTDLVTTLALGGDCLADIAVLRSQPELAGPLASCPVVSRLITAVAADAPRALRAIRKARAAARERAWALAGDRAPGGDGSLSPVDIDATIVIAQSEKEKTARDTFGARSDREDGAAGLNTAGPAPAGLVLQPEIVILRCDPASAAGGGMGVDAEVVV